MEHGTNHGCFHVLTSLFWDPRNVDTLLSYFGGSAGETIGGGEGGNCGVQDFKTGAGLHCLANATHPQSTAQCVVQAHTVQPLAPFRGASRMSMAPASPSNTLATTHKKSFRYYGHPWRS